MVCILHSGQDQPSDECDNAAAHLQNHTGEEPVQDTNGVLGLVVGWDGHVHIWQHRVCVAEGDGGDVHVGRLFDGLVVCAWVCHNQQPRLLKLLLDLVGEGS